jgi:plasmid stability protein
MSKAITIRDVPDETRDTLASRAAGSGQSLQEYLRTLLIEAASRPSMVELMRAVRTRKERTGSRLDPARIIEYRDADRR